MAGNAIRLGFDVDDGGAVRKINAVAKAFDKIGGKGSGAVLIGNVGAGAIGAIGDAVAAGFNLISDPIGTVTGFIGDAIQAAEKEEASVALLAKALENNVPAWDGNADALNAYLDAQIARGFADDDTRASLGQLVGITHDLAKAQELNTLAQDLARAKGLDLAEATDIVTKAAQGNSRILKGLGIDTAGVTDASTALEAIHRNVAGSTDAYNKTLEGKLNIAQQQFNEAVERAGGELLPVVAAGMQFLTDDVFPTLASWWDTATGAVRGVIDAISGVIGVFSRLAKMIGEFLGIGGVKGIGTIPPIPGLFIPKFAEGGSGVGSTVAMAGHGPEAIVSLSRAGRGGGFVPHTHEIVMDGKRITRRPQGVRVQADRRTLEMIDRGEGLFRLYRTAPTS